MFSAVASTIFAVRNVNKTQNGEVGRSTVALGQTAGVIQEIAKYDNIVSKTARSALSVFSDLAKEHKAFEYAGKFTKFAVDNVNPLICVSGVIKTMTSDDKLKTGITEAAALSAMFTGESLVKKNYDKVVNSSAFKNSLNKVSKNKYAKPIFEYLEKHNLKGKAGLIIKGLFFVSASISSYSIGQKIGGKLADVVKENETAPRKINQKA